MWRRLSVHGAAAAWILVTAVSLLLPVNPDLGDSFRWLPLPVDKTAHFVLFLVCCWLLHRSFRLELPRCALLVAAATTLVYGMATELLQGLVPSRSVDPRDMIANALGVAAYVGWVLGARAKARRSLRERR